MAHDRFAEPHRFNVLGFIQLLYDTTCLSTNLRVKHVPGLGWYVSLSFVCLSVERLRTARIKQNICVESNHLSSLPPMCDVMWTSSCAGAVLGTVLPGCGTQPLPGKRAGAATIWLIGQLRQCTVGKLTGHITIHSKPNSRWRRPQKRSDVLQYILARNFPSHFLVDSTYHLCKIAKIPII